MRLIIVTQNDVFYLPKMLNWLLPKLKSEVTFLGVICLPPSPYGKKESFLSKAIKTFKIFGYIFFMRYAFLYLLKKYILRQSAISVCDANDVDVIEVHGDINSPDNLGVIKALKPDVIVSLAGNQIFRASFLSIASICNLNVHSALLPRYRGLLPSFWVLKNGETYTGVSIFKIDLGIDTGPIVEQKMINIEGMTQEEVILATKKVGGELILSAIEKIKAGKYQEIANDDELATYYSFPRKQDVREFRKLGKKFF